MNDLLPGIAVLYEDDILLVVSKPQGMAVHPAPGSRSETLVQWLRQWYEWRGFPDRHVAAVSRLDKGTSGLILLATDPAAHPNLHLQVTGRQIRREYQCLVWGRPLFEETLVDVPLGRHWVDSRKMAAYDLPPKEAACWDARPARTRFQVLQRFGEMALLSATLETGRMHQIRVHSQFIRLPVVGDPKYSGGRISERMKDSEKDEGGRMKAEGEEEKSGGVGEWESGSVEESGNFDHWTAEEIAANLRWQCLHAGFLQFRHPLSGEALTFQSPIPPPFSTLLESLRHPSLGKVN